MTDKIGELRIKNGFKTETYTFLLSQDKEIDMHTRLTHVRSQPVLSVLCFLLPTLGGCASYHPLAVDEVPFKNHSQTKVDGNVRVTVAVLTHQEGEKIFGVDLALRWVQAVWVEVENKDSRNYWLLSSARITVPPPPDIDAGSAVF